MRGTDIQNDTASGVIVSPIGDFSKMIGTDLKHSVFVPGFQPQDSLAEPNYVVFVSTLFSVLLLCKITPWRATLCYCLAGEPVMAIL
jgi:hypothetical protein